MDQISYSPRQIRRGMTISIWAAILWSFYTAFVGGPIMAGLEVALRFSPEQCALINSMTNVFLPLQLVGLYIQERFFHRTRFWGTFAFMQFTFFGLLGVLAYFFPRFTPETGFLLFAMTFAAQGMCSSLISPIGMTWHADFVPPRASNAFWSKRNGMYMLFSMISGVMSGYLLDKLGQNSVVSYTIMLALGALFGYVACFIQVKIPDPNPYPARRRENPFRLFLETVRNKYFRTLVVFFSVQNAGSWLCAAFTTIYLITEMHMNMKTIQILAALSAAISFAFSYFFQIVGTKYGRKPVIVLCSALTGLQLLVYSTLLPGNTCLDDLGNRCIAFLGHALGFAPFTVPPGSLTLLPVYLMAGISSVGMSSAQQSLITSVGDRRIQGTAIALFYSIVGWSGALTGVASGYIYRCLASVRGIQEAGVHPFNILALAAAAVYFLSLFLIKNLHEDGAVNARRMMRVLITENAIRQVYLSHTLARPLSEERRVDKIQSLHGSLVAGDLLADLYSPSSRVRDEAVNHLSVMDKPSPEVVSALIKLATDAELGMRVPAMRALGRLRIASARPVAEKLAFENELPLSQAAVFTLGMIGDAASMPVLLKLIDSRKYAGLHAAAAEAVSRIGDRRGARAIFKAYLEEVNPTLVLQTLLALCRLWDGENGNAYRDFDAELKNPGDQLGKMLSEFCSLKPVKALPNAPDVDELTGLLDRADYHELGARVLSALFALRGIDAPDGAGIMALFTRDGHLKSGGDDDFTSTMEILAALWQDVSGRPDECFNRMRLFTMFRGARRQIAGGGEARPA